MPKFNVKESSKTKMLLEDIFQLDQAHLFGPVWEDNVGATYTCKVALRWPNMLVWGNVTTTQLYIFIQSLGQRKTNMVCMR